LLLAALSIATCRSLAIKATSHDKPVSPNAVTDTMMGEGTETPGPVNTGQIEAHIRLAYRIW